MTDKMTVAIAAGGTAGHINPALALAEELRDRGHHVVFVGQSRKLEGRLVPEAGFDFVPITVTGFDRSRPWTALTSLWRVNKAKRALANHFSKVGKPDAAIGFGAYVEVPLLGWCKGAGVPYLLHEQNSVPGLANKMMNSHAARVCISVPAARSVFEREGDPDHVLMTGNPVRRSVIEGDRDRGRKALGVPEDATLLLVFGGSLGAQHLNERVTSLKNELLSRKNLYVLHSTGADGFEETERALALTPEEAKRYRVQPYIDNMGDMLAAADLVLSRSGASSVAEIAALAVPRCSCRIRMRRPTTKPPMLVIWSTPGPACSAPMPISTVLPLPMSCCTWSMTRRRATPCVRRRVVWLRIEPPLFWRMR